MITLTVAAVVAIVWLGVRLAQPLSRSERATTDNGGWRWPFAALSGSVEGHDVVEFCEGVARSLRSSTSFESAVWAGAQWTDGVLGDELAAAREHVEAGEDIDVALRRVGDRVGCAELDRVIDAVGLCRPTGGPTAAVFDVMADAARSERDLESELAALATPARTSARVIGVLPLAFGLFAVLIDPGVLAALVSSPIGIACLVGGLIAEYVGFTWIKRIVEAT
jgi:tight adherence protein B